MATNLGQIQGSTQYGGEAAGALELNTYNANLGLAAAPAPYPTQPTAVATSQPTMAPAPVAPAEPTIAETLAGIKEKALQVQSQLNTYNSTRNLNYEKYPTYQELYKPIDERATQRNQMKLFQKEIAATNRVYNDMLGSERLAGQGRLGSQTAIAARSGLSGSDFGEAARQNQVGFNQQSERAIQNERLAKIGTIMGTMRKAVADEIANKRLARQQDANSYVEYLAGAKTRKESNVRLAASALLDAGIDPLRMDPNELAAIGKEANLSSADIIAQYRQLKASQDAAAAEGELKSRKTNAEIGLLDAKTESEGYFNLGEGQARYDREGNVIASKAKTYAPVRSSGSGLGSFSAGSLSEAAQALESTRGEDNYANTGVYLDLYEQAVAQDVLPQDFLKKFPPDLYLNPNDDSVPGYVKQEMEEIDYYDSI